MHVYCVHVNTIFTLHNNSLKFHINAFKIQIVILNFKTKNSNSHLVSITAARFADGTTIWRNCGFVRGW